MISLSDIGEEIQILLFTIIGELALFAVWVGLKINLIPIFMLIVGILGFGTAFALLLK